MIPRRGKHRSAVGPNEARAAKARREESDRKQNRTSTTGTPQRMSPKSPPPQWPPGQSPAAPLPRTVAWTYQPPRSAKRDPQPCYPKSAVIVQIRSPGQVKAEARRMPAALPCYPRTMQRRRSHSMDVRKVSKESGQGEGCERKPRAKTRAMQELMRRGKGSEKKRNANTRCMQGRR